MQAASPSLSIVFWILYSMYFFCHVSPPTSWFRLRVFSFFLLSASGFELQATFSFGAHVLSCLTVRSLSRAGCALVCVRSGANFIFSQVALPVVPAPPMKQPCSSQWLSCLELHEPGPWAWLVCLVCLPGYEPVLHSLAWGFLEYFMSGRAHGFSLNASVPLMHLSPVSLSVVSLFSWILTDACSCTSSAPTPQPLLLFMALSFCVAFWVISIVPFYCSSILSSALPNWLPHSFKF